MSITLAYQHIEYHAETSPQSTAVEYRQNSLTYQELNESANKLAHHLINSGVEHGTNIGVLMAPCEHIIIALFAIHKIGAVYIPLDPTFPKARMASILEEVSPHTIITDGQTPIKLSEYNDRCLDISLIHGTANQLPNTNPEQSIDDAQTSHIYFTSGTTGKPKGVIATQANLTHYMHSAKNAYRFNANDKFIAAARFTFSISLFEILLPLVCGGTVRLLPREEILNLPQLAKHFEWATVFHIGPSLLNNILPYIETHYSDFTAFDRMRHVSSGGDMIPPHTLERLKKIFSHAEVYVIYGSSEISCMGCTYPVPRDCTISKTLVGKPHQDVSLKVVDDSGNVVPTGTTGNILFSGKGLVKGYLNLDHLTAEKFTLINGERFYDIGDVGKLDEDGNLEMQGRKDFQVQIKGMRVELVEIETCLRQLAEIKDVVVSAAALTETDNDEKALLAYIVFNESKSLSLADLLSHAKHYLADYMVPSRFIKLDAMPLNHNGKLDRKALPLPTSDNTMTSNETIVPPNNSTEEELIGIWQRLFNSKNIGINNNFFEMGGDSLLAVKFLTEIDQKYGKLIPITAILSLPTIEGFAKALLSDEKIFGTNDVTILKPGNPKPPLYCLYGVLLYKDLAASLECDRPVCGVYIEEEVALMRDSGNAEALEAFSSVDKIASRYAKSIRAFQPHGPYYLCGLSFGGITALEVARQLIDQGEEVKLIAMFDSRGPDLANQSSSLKKLELHLKQIKNQGWSYLYKKLERKLQETNILKKVITSNTDINANNNTDQNSNDDARANARSLASQYYTPLPFEQEVMLFKAEQRNSFEIDSEDLGWSKTLKNLSVYTIPGDHLGILKPGQVEVLAKYISPRLKDH